MFDKNGDGFLGADETPAQGNNGNPGQANGQFPPEKVFTVKLAANRNIGVIYNDRQSDVVVLLLPGANQDKALARNYNMLAPGFNKLGYSTASIYTNFGPLVDSRGHQNNKHLLRVMSAIKKRYGNREFILYGGSNGGRSALQAAERSRRGIRAVIAHPAVYLPKRNMKGLPVYLRIGAKDGLGWAKYFDRMSQGLTRLGAKVNAKLVPNAGHIPMADMSQIGPWLKKHEIEPGKVVKP